MKFTIADILSKYFLLARFVPALIVSLPVIFITAPFIDISDLSKYQFFGFVVFIFIGLYIIAGVLRHSSKKLEEKLFLKWEAKPTTIILRHSDTTIDENTKRRLHRFLENRIDDLVIPSPTKEKNNPDSADQSYSSATHWLLSNTRDKNKYPLVFEENINYGFKRNLYSAKLFSILLVFSMILIQLFLLIFLKDHFDNVQTLLFMFLNLSLLWFWLFVITEEWLKKSAFDYAEQLINTIDSL